jgi:hypothetical protein
MARRLSRDWTVEDYEKWSRAQGDVDRTLAVTEEEGGPRVSLVPDPTSVPLDLLPDEVTVPAVLVPVDSCAAGDNPAVPFTPQPSRKTGGWSAERQRTFIETLAETGSVHVAAKSAGLSARSAYAVRVRSRPFAAAWDAANRSPSAACPRSPSTAPSTAASSRSIMRGCWSAKSASPASGC